MKKETIRMRIGFIGLGNTGRATASNLLKAGHQLSVYSKTYEDVEEIVELGASYADSPRMAAVGSEIIFTMLPNDKAVEEAVFGMQGILNGMAKNSIHISMSAVSNDMAQKLAAVHTDKKQQFIFAKVIETQSEVEMSELQIVLSGPQSVREQVIPVLESLDQEMFRASDQAESEDEIEFRTNLLLAFAV